MQRQSAFRSIDRDDTARLALCVPIAESPPSPARSPRSADRPTDRCTSASASARRRRVAVRRRAAELDEGDLLEEAAQDLDAVAALAALAPRFDEGAVVVVVRRVLDVRRATALRPSPRRRASADGRSRRRCRSGTALPARRSRGSCRASPSSCGCRTPPRGRRGRRRPSASCTESQVGPSAGPTRPRWPVAVMRARPPAAVPPLG